MNAPILEIKLESEIFEDARFKFNKTLQALLMQMRESKSEEGSITLKIDVRNYKQEITGADYHPREVEVPVFGYKVSSAVNVKNSINGIKSPEMELVYDEHDDEFTLQPIKNQAQRSLWDD